MQPGTRLFLVNLSQGMCIKNDNGIARSKSSKNFAKFRLEASLKFSTTFQSLKCIEPPTTTASVLTTTTFPEDSADKNMTIQIPDENLQPVPLTTTAKP